MSNINQADDLWRQIPPEEKLELMSRAHGIGVVSAGLGIVLGSAFAVGLHMPWCLWGSLLIAPIIFQFSAGRTWRTIRPVIMLEYLAARSAARRFAFAAKSKDLNMTMMFRGHMEELFDKDHKQEELEAAIAKTKEAAVWIALFRDTVVLLSEKTGGAEMQFAQPLTDKLEVEVHNAEEGKDYANGKTITLGYQSKLTGTRRVRLSSPYPAALVVFEKLLLRRKQEEEERLKLLSALAPKADGTSDDEATEY